jgi:toxin-antitoxin system PIN domain toxin
VILVDANVLLYAYHPRAEQHERCRPWVETAFSGPDPVGLAWMTVQAFLRIGTNPRAFEHPLSIDEASAIVSEWLALPAVALVEPGEQYWEILRKLLCEGQVAGPLVSDAALAALALDHGAALCTTDRDFTRFPGLRLVNPLAG